MVVVAVRLGLISDISGGVLRTLRAAVETKEISILVALPVPELLTRIGIWFTAPGVSADCSALKWRSTLPFKRMFAEVVSVSDTDWKGCRLVIAPHEIVIGNAYPPTATCEPIFRSKVSGITAPDGSWFVT
jgi:hypothetical protein